MLRFLRVPQAAVHLQPEPTEHAATSLPMCSVRTSNLPCRVSEKNIPRIGRNIRSSSQGPTHRGAPHVLIVDVGGGCPEVRRAVEHRQEGEHSTAVEDWQFANGSLVWQ